MSVDTTGTTASAARTGRRAGRAWPYAASGALAAVTGAGVGHLVAALVAPVGSPVPAVGSVVIDATPTAVKEWAISWFGTADKTVLVGSVLLVTVLLAAGTGLLARRRRTLGLVALVGLVALATAAAVSRPAAGPAAILPGLVTAVVGLVTLNALATLLDRLDLEREREAALAAEGEGAMPTADRTLATRRSVLAVASGAGVAAVAGVGAGQALTSRSAPTQGSLPAPASPLPPLPQGLESTIRGISPFRTPVSDFYRIDTALIVPRVSPGDWSLTVDGEVDHQVSLTLADLLAMPMVEKDITLMCVSNEIGGDLVGSARWLGVPTKDILARAGVHASADQVLSTSVDGMTISTPIQALTDDRGALLAVGMDGAPLPADHGFPVRLVTPGLYGFVGATKWLARMTVTTYAASQAYWTRRDWASDAPCLTESRIDTPRQGADLLPGATHIGGVAWAQGRGITAVEVRVDDGPWQRATLGPDAGIDYWRQWYLPWQATPGNHTLAVRATDGQGDLQTVVVADPFPRGATGWHTIDVSVG
jgi:DMSO/TMAO reductase YedYZ molybdopterin-dependent catalytic subunit